MQINGIELEIRLTNASFAGRFEKAVRDLNQAIKGKPAFDDLEAAIRYQCDAVKKFVLGVFGDGVYEKLGVDPEDLDENYQLMEDIMAEAEKQKNSIVSKRSKYTPNRAQRRAKR